VFRIRQVARHARVTERDGPASAICASVERPDDQMSGGRAGNARARTDPPADAGTP